MFFFLEYHSIVQVTGIGDRQISMGGWACSIQWGQVDFLISLPAEQVDYSDLIVMSLNMLESLTNAKMTLEAH